MSNYITDIQLSGVTYTLSAQTSGGSGATVSEVTQAQYDALVSGGTVDPTVLYIITDAQAGDLTQYWTSAQTQSAITQATSGKVNTSSVVSSVTSASTDSEIPTAKAVFDAIPTGGTGGGKAIEAGTNISVTTGETADTVSCTLPYYKDSGNCWTIYGYNNMYANSSTKTDNSAYIGFNNVINNTSSTRTTEKNIIIGFGNKLESQYTEYFLGGNIIIGENNTLSGSNNIRESYVIGKYNKGYGIQEFICGWSNETRNTYETSFGYRNISTSGAVTFGYSGNTLFSIGNGNYFGSNRHNAFEIRQNGDIYIADTNDTSTSNYYEKPMIKLQDALGGGGSSINVVQTTGSSTTDVMSQAAVTNIIGDIETLLSNI